MNVTLVPGFNPGPYTGTGNNTYLITGATPTLIDAATGLAEHLDAVATALAGTDLARVLVTHGHSDHAAGSAALACRWPRAEFLKMPWPERDDAFSIRWRRVAHRERIPVGDVVLRVLHTPGHSPDHLCFFEEESRTLFSGDLVIQGRTVVIPASHGGSLVSYLDSPEVIRDLDPRRVLPAHGPEITDLPALVEEYVHHRKRREAEVVQVLSSSPMTRESLVEKIYIGLPAELTGAAGESVLAHLVKLRDEGQVREHDGWWILSAR